MTEPSVGDVTLAMTDSSLMATHALQSVLITGERRLPEEDDPRATQYANNAVTLTAGLQHWRATEDSKLQGAQEEPGAASPEEHQGTGLDHEPEEGTCGL